MEGQENETTTWEGQHSEEACGVIGTKMTGEIERRRGTGTGRGRAMKHDGMRRIYLKRQ